MIYLKIPLMFQTLFLAWFLCFAMLAEVAMGVTLNLTMSVSQHYQFHTHATDSVVAIHVNDSDPSTDILICYSDIAYSSSRPKPVCNSAKFMSDNSMAFSESSAFDSKGRDPFALMINESQVLLGYTHGYDSGSGDGKAVIGTIDPFGVPKYDFETRHIFNTMPNDQTTLVGMHYNGKLEGFVVCYSKHSDNSVMACRPGNFTNGTPSYGNENFLSSGYSTNGLALISLGRDRFVACYSFGSSDVQSNGHGKTLGVCQMGLVNGQNITVSKPVVFNNASVDKITFAKLGTYRYAVCYVDEGGTGHGACSQLEVDNSTSSLRFSNRQLFMKTPVDETTMVLLDSSRFAPTLMLCYVDVHTRWQVGKCLFGSLSKCADGPCLPATWSRPFLFNNVTTDEINLLPSKDKSKMILCFVDGLDAKGSCAVASIVTI
eukprot:m.5161 g.5161  ORF g.5161 m.5161 type:complete len:431 (-) comp3235_c0_seq1:177-1469(-)